MSRMTAHAQVRRQQRGLSVMEIELLLKFGTHKPDRDGASKVYFDKHARRSLLRYAGPAIARHLAERLKLYAVVSDTDEIITVGHITKRI